MSTGKRYVFIILLIQVFMVFCRQLSADNFEVDLSGGVCGAAMGEYNSRISDLNGYNALLGASTSLTKFTYEPSPSFCISRNFSTPFGQAAVYLRNDFIVMLERQNISTWAGGGPAQTLNGDFSVFYSAAGGKYFYSPEGATGIEFYLNADAGLCHYYSNYETEVDAKPDGVVQSSIKKSWKTAIPAASIGAGANWWIGGGMGFGACAGYRLSSGRVTVSIHDQLGTGGTSQGEDSVDYSGLYASAGIIFRFGEDDPGKNTRPGNTSDTQFLEITVRLYSEAEKLYSQGMLRQALEKNTEALKLSPGDERLLAQSKEIKDAIEKKGGPNNVGALKDEAEEFRRLKKFQSARLRYMEIKAIEPENPYALYYLKDFDEKAAQLLTKAQSAFANDNEKALKAAARALEYSPDNKDLKEIYTSIVKKGLLKEQADKMFNQAVDLFDKGGYEEAAELWKEVLNLNPDDAGAKQNLEKAIEKSGEKLKEKSIDAKKAYDEAVKAYKIGNMKAAALKCEYVLRMDPDDLDSMKMLDDIKKIKEGEEKQALPKR